MSTAHKYKVILSGVVEEGYDQDHALAAFADLFKVSADQAQVFFQGQPRVLRKDLEERQAQTYLSALKKIGLAPKVERQPEVGNAQGEADAANLVALGAAAVAALIGALVWMLIAVGFGYELGIVAWGIGGAVGIAAAALGGRGQAAGAICGTLALLAILGGKFLAVDSIQSSIADVLADQQMWDSETEAYFEELRVDADLYGSIGTDEHSLRRFMVDRGYTAADSVPEVSVEELAFFYTYEQPTLSWVADTKPSYEEWQAYAMQEITELSTLDLVTSELGILDGIFLLLGIGTAFRLGRGSIREETASA